MKNIKDIIRTWNPERQAAEMVLRPYNCYYRELISFILQA